ncbi:hypothetical protein BSKO_01227 [Bryopsis sp. KO-2023]|nr:hypothetical protein BSKO_01227 [Bryopsis sp. KO-2023]
MQATSKIPCWKSRVATGNARRLCRHMARPLVRPSLQGFTTTFRNNNKQIMYGRQPLKAARALGPEFTMPSAPIDISEGPWSVIEGGGLTAPEGFSAAGISAGVRAVKGKADLSLVYCDEPALCAGVFTQNVVCAAPVTYCKTRLSEKKTTRAIMTNAGQANAVTGEDGYNDAVRCAEALGQELAVAPEDVLLLSTGVIGRRIKMDELIAGLPQLVSELGDKPENGLKAATAMTTTDLVSKSVAIEVPIGGVPVRLGSACKGSGMIHPNMATMLGIVTCDAPVAEDVWQEMLSRATKRSFNMITVDGDTSTNDTVLALASGRVDIPTISDIQSEAGQILQRSLESIMQGMAKSIAWDGEGATCLMEIKATGAATEDDAILMAKSVGGSMLTKAAVFGHDPNWGRIACAVGYSGAKFPPESLDIFIGPHALMRNGTPLDFDASAVSSYLKDRCDAHGTVNVSISVGDGPGEATAWGCDLSYDYVKINAEYTT